MCRQRRRQPADVLTGRIKLATYRSLEKTMKAIVTGHTRGLGQAMASALLGRGIPVLGLARSACPELTEQFPERLQQATVDLADPDALQLWLDGNVLDSYLAGATSVLLVNNAGMLGPVAPLGRQEGNALVQAVNLNITAPLQLSNALARKYQGPLRIAHISSGAGRSAFAGWSIYGATKAASTTTPVALQRTVSAACAFAASRRALSTPTCRRRYAAPQPRIFRCSTASSPSSTRANSLRPLTRPNGWSAICSVRISAKRR